MCLTFPPVRYVVVVVVCFMVLQSNCQGSLSFGYQTGTSLIQRRVNSPKVASQWSKSQQVILNIKESSRQFHAT